MDLSQLELCLVGAGKMGGAMLLGWLEQGLSAHNVRVIDPGMPDAMQGLAKDKGFHLTANPEGLMQPHILVVAVKPQMMDAVLPGLNQLVGPETVLVSVAAGTPIATFQSYLGDDLKVVRAMPNTPAQVGRGMTAACASDGVNGTMRSIVAQLLSSMGTFVWVEEESQIDAVTAISGSGPAYVFHMVEALSEAGQALGLAPDIAATLARQTVVGAGELLHQSPLEAEELRINVTSPGGTTAAALEVLMNAEDGLVQLMKRATEAARDRSIALS